MRKHLIFRYYWLIAIIGSAVGIVAVYRLRLHGREGLAGTILVAALGLCYFAQTQKLQELRLFKDLFTEFNSRYDKMNAALEDIRAGNKIGDSQVRETLVAYFNLCAEEYLFYSEGFIHQDAWRSWCLGMRYNLGHTHIQEIWNDEVRQESYYGLTSDIIEKGANLRGSSRRTQEQVPT